MATKTKLENRSLEGNTTKHVDSILNSMEKIQFQSMDDTMETLRSRLNEQASLIFTLKQRENEMLLQRQTLQQTNTVLEDRVTHYQEDLESERKRAAILHKRFINLANNHKEIISFMEDYKRQNAQLRLENKELHLENETLFSRKIQEKEEFIRNLMEEAKQLKVKDTNKENEYREKIANLQSKLVEQATAHQTKEASLVYQLHNAQKQHRDAVNTCQEFKLKLQRIEEEHTVRETNLRESTTSLTEEKDKLLLLSRERRKVIEEKDKEIEQLKMNWKEEKIVRVKAEERFLQEAEAVQADVKVKSLQAELEKSMMKYATFKREFEAFKEHSSKLLRQERELNEKLRHMTT